MPLTIVCRDITQLPVDAVVNAANTDLAMGGGVCGAIFRAAGARELQAACALVSPIRTGEAAITPGFALSKYVIHAAGPIYDRRDAARCERLLRAAYTSALRLAATHGCASVAFPLISAGIYGYPKEAALRVARDAIQAFLRERDMDVYLAIVDRELYERCGEE